MKPNIIHILTFIVFSLLIHKLTYAQVCDINSDKSITVNSQIDKPCASYTARDNIVLKPGFSFTASQDYFIAEFTWYFGGEVLGEWVPSLTLNDIPYSNTWDYIYTFQDFLDCMKSFRNYLAQEYTTTLSYSDGEFVTLRIEKNKDFTFSGNYDEENVPSPEINFTAKIDERLVLPVDYLSKDAIPDLTSRKSETGLPFGSIEGTLNVTPTGAATYEIPIMVPNGLNGLEPKISVNYNSQSGNGLLGWGFNISGLSAITRTPKNLYSDNETKGISIDKEDRFVLDGNRLVSESGTYGGNESTYRTENETFQHIISYGYYGDGPSRFEIYAKNGTRYKYGSQTGRVAYSASLKDAIVSWYLDYVEDIYGNTIQYTYEQKGLALYLTKITYGTNKSGIGTENSIEFFYEKRWDPIPIYYQPIKGQVDQILNKIVTKTGSQVLRTYVFEYTTDAFSRLSKVTEFNGAGEHLNPTYFGWGKFNTFKSDPINSLPVDYFSWQVSLGQRSWTTGDVNGDGITDLLSFFYYDYEKINVVQPFIASVSSTGVVSYVAGVPYRYLPNAVWGYFNCYSSVAAIQNLNGDNVPEIVIPSFNKFQETNQMGFYVVNALESNPLFWQDLLSTTTEMPAYAIDDLNNDGIDDIVYIENSKINNLYQGKIHYGEYNPGWSNPINTTWLPFNISLNTPAKRLFTGDYNRDGLIDILIVNDEGFIICINKGNQNFTPTSLVTNLFKSTNDILKPGDFNGDGLIDFVYNEHESPNWYFAINNGDLGFNKRSLPITAQNENFTDKDNETHNCIVMDFDNDGKSDLIVFDADYEYHKSWDPINQTLVWGTFKQFTTSWYKSTGENVSQIFPGRISSIERDAFSRLYVFGDFNGDRLPDLMNYGYDCYGGTETTQAWRMYTTPNSNYDAGMVNSISNGLGLNTTISYSSTSQKINYSDKYASPFYPLALLNSPVPVVKEITEPNGVSSNVVQKYSYQDGTLDLQRGFLGFGKFQMTRNIANPTTEKDISIEQNYEFDLNYNNTHYYQPYLVSSKTTVGSTLISESNIPLSSYSVTQLSNGQKHVFMYPGVSNQIDHLKKTLVTTTVTYDSDGNILTNEVNTSDYDPASPVLIASQKTTYSGYQSRISSNLNTYKNAPDNVTVEQTHRDATGTFSTTTAFEYNITNGTLKQKTDFFGTPKALISSYTYDAVGNLLTTTTGERKSTLEYTTDKRFLKKQINALDHFTETEYDLWGNPVKKWDINRNSTVYGYDAWGNLTTVVTPDNRKVISSTEWFDKGNASIQLAGVLYYTSSVDEDNHLIGAEYFDAAGHSLRKADAGFNGSIFYTDYVYNKSGQAEQVSDLYLSGGTATKFTVNLYDDYGRIKEQTLPNLVMIKTEYSGDINRRTTTSYSTGEIYTKEYDAAGLLVKSTDPGGSITYKYYKNSKPSEIQPSGGVKATSVIYDESTGLQKELRDPDAGTTKYDYNLYGELSSQTDARSKNTTITYDDLGRVETKTMGSDFFEYSYDNSGAYGPLSTVKKNGSVIKSLKYDGMGRAIEESRSNGSVSFTYKYGYDEKSRLHQMTYPNNLVLTYGYTRDNLTSISKDGSSIWTLNPNDVNEFGQIKKISLGNGKSTVYGYDDQKRLNKITVEGILDFGYKFNDQQQLEFRDEKISNGTVLKSLAENFKYDPVNRLTHVYDNSTPQVLKLEMKYDADRMKFKSDAGTFNYPTIENHKLDQITELKTIFPQHFITYTDEDQVKTVAETNDAEGNKLLSIEYGSDGQRFKNEYSQSGVRKYTRYYFDTYEKEVLSDGSERHLNYIYAGKDLVAILEQKAGVDKMHYIYTDYLGSLRCITDASGNIEQRLSYDAWGNRRKYDDDSKLSSTELAQSISLTSRGFTGHEHLDELGLINMNGRVYDPALGIFLSPDDYVQAPDFTQNFNRYAYCLNNPLMFTDPSGEKFSIWHFLAASFFGTASWQSIINYESGKYNLGQAIGMYFVNGSAFIAGAGITNGIGSLQMGGTFLEGFTGSCMIESSFISSAIGGFAGGFITGTGTGLIEGQSFGEALWTGINSGIIAGAIAGTIGGLDALRDDRRFFDGAYINDKILADQNIPKIGQIGDNNCLPASASAVDRSLGGNLTQDQIRELISPGSNPITTPLNDYSSWQSYSRASGHTFFTDPQKSTSLERIARAMQGGNRVAINLSTGEVGHSVVLKSVTERTITTLHGKVITKYLFSAMNPARGGYFSSLSARKIINSYNIFYIFR